MRVIRTSSPLFLCTALIFLVEACIGCTKPSDCNSLNCDDCFCHLEVCNCTGTGWSGSNCQIPFCSQTDNSTCSNHGSCTMTPHAVFCECNPGFTGTRCETATCSIHCGHGGTPNAACTQCDNCKGAWKGALDQGTPFSAPVSSTYSTAIPINSYVCGTDHVFSPIVNATNKLFVNQTLPMYQQLVPRCACIRGA